MTHKTKLIIAIVIGLILGLGVTLIVMIWSGYRHYSKVFVDTRLISHTTPAPEATPTPTPDPLAPFGVLIMGFGGPNHDGGYLTDTMILAYVEQRKEQITLISLPRDIWVELPITSQESKPFKINHAYAVGRDHRRYPDKPSQFLTDSGGGMLAKQIVSQVTGLDVQYFIALSFEGFTNSIDTLGGVTVTVPVTFDDFFYPIEANKDETCGIGEEEIVQRTATLSGQKLEQSFTCRYEHLHFEAGRQVLDGDTALKFVRSRHSLQHGGDYARSIRQRALITGIRDQVYSVNFLPKMIPFMSNLTQDMQMDIDLTTLQTWIGKADQFKTYKINSIGLSEENVLKSGVSSDRQYILQPKSGMYEWGEVQQFIRGELEGE